MQPLEPKRSVYDTCDPQYLRELREAADMDVLILARTACLSVAQVRQLESDGSDSLFYSDSIKRQAYKRVLMILGAEPPSVEIPEVLRDAHQVADAHLDTLNQIVAMSQQPSISPSVFDYLRTNATKLMSHKQALASFLFLVAAVALFLLQGPKGVAEAEEQVLASALPNATLIKPSPLTESVASAPVALASTPVVTPAPAVIAASAAVACAYANDAVPQLSPFVGRKEGRYVYLVSSVNAELCVVDGNKQATTLQMKAGENRSVYGVSPWQVSSANLQKIQIYFQGGRVTLPDAVTNRVTLLEVPVVR